MKKYDLPLGFTNDTSKWTVYYNVKNDTIVNLYNGNVLVVETEQNYYTINNFEDSDSYVFIGELDD